MELKNQIKSLLKHVILAPSGYNTQPWKFKLGQNTLEIIPDYTRARLNTDPDYREFFMSLGAAATNLEISAKNIGLSFKKSYRLNDKDNDYAICYKFSDSKNKESYAHPLFKAISQRRTNRSPYLSDRLPKSLVKVIRNLPYPNDVELNLITRPGDITTFSNLIHQSYFNWYKNKLLVKELESWLRDDLSLSKDGLPTGVLNLYKLAVNAKYVMIKKDQSISDRSEYSQNLAKNSPALILLSTRHDSVQNWFQAGEFYELLALTLTSHGYSIDFFNQPLFLKKSRRDASRIVGSQFQPQLLFRIGLPTVKAPKNRRRPLKEFLIS